MRRIKVFLLVVGVMALLVASAAPALADNNFRFNNNDCNDNGFNNFRFNDNDCNDGFNNFRFNDNNNFFRHNNHRGGFVCRKGNKVKHVSGKKVNRLENRGFNCRHV